MTNSRRRLEQVIDSKYCRKEVHKFHRAANKKLNVTTTSLYAKQIIWK